MKRVAVDLERLKAEIQNFLTETGLAVFYGYARAANSAVYWDTERHGDFREFVAIAQQAGAKLVVFSEQQFSSDRLEDALYQLEECDLPQEERRNYESRLHQFEAYEGFTCSLELSFDLDGRAYVFELDADWYNTFSRIAAEIETYLPESEEAGEEEEGPIGGYFSNN